MPVHVSTQRWQGARVRTDTPQGSTASICLKRAGQPPRFRAEETNDGMRLGSMLYMPSST